MSKVFKIIVLLLSFSSAAYSALWVQTHDFGTFYPGNGLDPYTETWGFNKFDDHGGEWTLSAITIDFVLYAWDGFIGQDNDGTTSASGSVGLEMLGNVSSPDVHYFNDNLVSLNASILQEGTFNLVANDGDPAGDQYDVGGLDWDSLSGADESDPAQDTASTPVFPTSFSDFIGAGTFEMSLVASQAKYVIEDGAIATLTNPQKADGYVRVTYDFVPEPMTMSLMGSGGLIALLANRMRRKSE